MLKNKLREVREGQGLSQTELTVLTGIASPVISAIEHGKVYAHPGWRQRLAEALNVPEDHIFGEVEK